MLQEMELHKALKAFAAGRKVKVLERKTTDPEDENYEVTDLADWFKHCRLLVEVPAIANPHFEEAVQEMVEQISHLPLASKNRPASVWVPVPNEDQ